MSQHLDALERDPHQRRAFAIHVAGLPVYWHTQYAPPVRLATTYGSTGLPYLMRPWLQSVGRMSEEVDPKGGIARTSAPRVVLKSPAEYVRRGSPLDPPNIRNNPLRVLPANRHDGVPEAWLRLRTEAAAGWTARPLATIPAAAVPAGIPVDTSPAPLFASGAAEVTLHIGQEAFTCTGYSGTGGSGDPYTLTGIERAVLRTQVGRHIVDGTQYNAPVIRQRALNMRGRRVTIWVGALDDQHVVGRWQPFFRGVIASTPNKRGVGEVELDLVDHLTRLMDDGRDLGGQMGLCVGHRKMTSASRASAVELALRWPATRLINAGDAWADAPKTKLAMEAGAAIYNQVADDSLDDNHPRRIPFLAESALDLAIPSGTFDDPVDGTDDGLVFPDTKPRLEAVGLGGIDGSRAGNAEIAEVLRADLALSDGEVVAWPDVVTEAFAAQLTPGTAAGVDGQWANVVLGGSHATGWRLGVQLTSSLTDDAALHVDTWGRRGPPRNPAMYGGGPMRWTADGELPPADELEGAWGLVDLRSPDAWERGDAYEARPVPAGGRLPVRGPCVAGYQRGERYISVGLEAAKLVGAGPFSLRIEYQDEAGDAATAWAPIVSVSTMTYEGDVVGYALEVDEVARGQVPTFGHWYGQQAPRLTPVLQWMDVDDPGEVLASALLSAYGTGVRHATWDDRLGGLGLESSEVDVESILAHPVPSQLSPWHVRHEAGKPLGETIQQLLVATGTALVWRRVGEQCRITRVAMGFEGAGFSVASLNDHQTTGLQELDPERKRDGGPGDGANRVDIKLGAADGEPDPPTYRFNFGHLDAEMGEESRGVEIELPGLRLLTNEPSEGFTRLAALASRVKSVGQRRVRWGGDVPSSWVAFRSLGDVVLVTSVDLDGDTPVETADAAPARIIALDIGWDEPTSAVEMTHDGARSAGYAPSARVASQVDADTIELEDRIYCLDTDPRTGETGRLDIDYFAAGDVVRLEPRGDADSAVTRTIASVDRATRRVTFTAAHGGVSAGDVMLPAAWTSASDAHRQYAYVTDDDGEVDGAPGSTLA